MKTCEATAISVVGKQTAISDWSATFTSGRMALLLFLLLFAAYPEVFLGTHSFFNGDFALFTYPIAFYTRESIWHGELPLWNPLSDCGLPFLAQWNTTVCYPLSWFYILFPLPWSLNYFCLGHLVLAGVGMYALAFRWTKNRFAASVAGLAYGLNGFSLNALVWTSILAAIAWLPITVLCVERAWREGRRHIIWGGLSAAMQVLSGAPEFVLITWLLLGTLWAAQALKGTCRFAATARRLCLVALIVAGLTAIQILPFLELLRNCDRHPGWIGSGWSMPAWGLANFFVPLFRCSRSIVGPAFQPEQQWTSSYYLGISIMALGLVAVWRVRSPRVWWLAGGALLGVLLGLGDYGLLLPMLHHLCPGLSLARYPIKFVIATVFAFPLLAALGIQWILKPRTTGDLPSRQTLLVTTLLSSILIGAIVGFAGLFPYSGQAWNLTLKNGIERGLFLILILNALILLTKARNFVLSGWLGITILVVMGLDVLSHMPPQNPTVTKHAYDPLALEMSVIPRLGEGRAMMSPQMQSLLTRVARPDPLLQCVSNRRCLFEDSNLTLGVPKVNGFFPLYLGEESKVKSVLYSPTNLPVGLADFVGVSQISSPENYWRWEERRSAMPLASIGQQPVFEDGDATLKAIGSPNFNPRAVVYLPPEARQNISASGTSSAEITGSRFSAHEVSLDVSVGERTMVVIAQSFFPCWWAYVDGNATRLWKANYAFQALEVSGGKHRVVLRYCDRWFNTGAVISGITLLCCLVAGVWHTFCARIGINRRFPQPNDNL